jgi:hypothetical protein
MGKGATNVDMLAADPAAEDELASTRLVSPSCTGEEEEEREYERAERLGTAVQAAVGRKRRMRPFAWADLTITSSSSSFFVACVDTWCKEEEDGEEEEEEEVEGGDIDGSEKEEANAAAAEALGLAQI